MGESQGQNDPSSEVSRWYRSKVDRWVGVLLVVPPIASGVALVSLAAAGRLGLAGLIGPAFVALLYVGLVFPIRYGLGPQVLVVRFGLVRRRIPLDAIRAVEPTNSPLSSPALSLDRLRIVFGDGLAGTVMISPDNRDAFLADLLARCPLRRSQGGWSRH